MTSIDINQWSFMGKLLVIFIFWMGLRFTLRILMPLMICAVTRSTIYMDQKFGKDGFVRLK